MSPSFGESLEFPLGGYYLQEEISYLDNTLYDVAEFVSIMDTDLDELIERQRIVASAERGHRVPDDIHQAAMESRAAALSRNVSYATLLTVVLTIESELVRFCNILCDEFNPGIRPSNLRGDVLERSRDYIEKVSQWRGRPDPTVWKALRDLFEVRNIIVHSAGEFVAGLEERKWSDLAQRNPGVSVERSTVSAWRGLTIDARYCRGAVTNARRFFVSLYSPCWLDTWAPEQNARRISIYTAKRLLLEGDPSE